MATLIAPWAAIAAAWKSSAGVRAALLLSALALVVIVAVVAQVTHRQVAIELARTSEANAATAEEYLRRTLEDSRRVLRAIAAWIERSDVTDPTANDELIALAENLNIDAPATAAIAIIDAAGEARLLHRDYLGQSFNVAQRPYFPVGAASPLGVFSYGPLLVNSNTGKATVSVMLKIHLAGEEAVLATAFAVEPLKRFLSGIVVSPSGLAGVFSSRPQAQGREMIALVDMQGADLAIADVVARAPDNGKGWNELALESGELRVFHRSLRDVPFQVVIGYPKSEILGLWWQRNVLSVALFAVATVVLAGLALFVLVLHGRRIVDAAKLHATSEKLSLANERFELAGGQAGIWDWDIATDECYFSPHFFQMLGYSEHEFRQELNGSIPNLVHPDDRAHYREQLRAHLENPRQPYRSEHRYRTKSGEYRWFLARGQSLLDGAGAPLRLAGLLTDTTERRQAEISLQQSEVRLRESREMLKSVLDTIPARVFWKDRDLRIMGCNQAFARDAGFDSVEEVVGLTDFDLAARDQAELYRRDDKVVIAEGKQILNTIEPQTRPDGSLRWLRTSKTPLIDENRRIIGILGTYEDITDLRETEKQLQQSQKMEAVGQLTGGIAHDFNNVLGVVLGNLELLADSLDGDTDRLPRIEAAMRAAGRGADLTHRLLAFSRKQALSPEPIEADRLAKDMGDLLARSLGEAIDLQISAADDLWRCLADPGQLESAILNLAINARDAMPSGGKLSIHLSNAQLGEDYAAAHADAEPGDYVLIAVTDTGCGISADVRDHVFEPFYTSKPAGQGTGLGLSMVYGFAMQSNGHVTLYSELDQGTTFKLYLPRHEGEAVAAKEAASESAPDLADGERVLVVEDDADLRTLVVTMLRSLGYEVLNAGTGKEALAVLDKADGVQLLLTDVVLPGGMGGRDLADLVSETRPGLPVLYMSGYSQNAIIHQGRLDPGVQLLEKPFRKAEVASAVRQALRRKAG